METSNPSLNKDKRTIDALFYQLQFQSLLDLAVDTCLREPLQIPETTTAPHQEAILIQQLGLRGLRTALELSYDFGQYELHLDERYDEVEGAEYIKVDSTMRSPADFSDDIRPEIYQQVAAFGDALMRESYAILGPGADEQVERLRQAVTIEDCYQVTAWLDQRLSAIAKHEDSQEETTKHHYHPIRLSPKVVGSYPNHRLPSTCLGVSIIAAEFFRRADCEVLHAGVMESGFEERLRGVAILYDHILRQRDDSRYHAPSTPKLQLMYTRVMARRNVDAGYHAAVYAKLPGEQGWLQFDSNFDSTCYLESGNIASVRLQHSHDTLQEFSDIAPGLELSVGLQAEPSLAFFGLSGTFDELSDAPSDGLDRLLQDVSDGDRESFAQRLYDEYVLPAFHQGDSGSVSNAAAAMIDNISTSNGIEPLLQAMFHSFFTKYVLWGQPLSDALDRLMVDVPFRQRFKDDAQQCLLLLLAQLSAYEATNPYCSGKLHQSIEAGLPEVRIGFAALNDFAQYCDNSLPPSFWLSHWPSYIPITETIRDNPLPHQTGLSHNLAGHAVVQPAEYLTYTKLYDKVESLVSDPSNEGNE